MEKNNQRIDMEPSKRYRAFTIMEMLVTLVLSGIIIAASLQFYLNYEKLIHMKNQQMDCGKEIYQFYHTFKHEFDNALYVQTSEEREIVIRQANQRVRYNFEKEYVLRSVAEQSDTFFVKVNALEILKDDITGFDKSIRMELSDCGVVYPVSLAKEYSNDMLMNKTLSGAKY